MEFHYGTTGHPWHDTMNNVGVFHRFSLNDSFKNLHVKR